MKTIRTKVYQFKELSKEAQEKALMEQAQYISEFIGPNSVFMKSAKKMNRLKTPWFLASCIYEEQRTELIEEITINEYNYTKEGKIFNS